MNAVVTAMQITNYTKKLMNVKNMVRSDKALWFDISISGKRGPFKVEITMGDNDSYTVKLMRLQGKTLELVTLATREMVFVEQLNSTLQRFVLVGW